MPTTPRGLASNGGARRAARRSSSDTGGDAARLLDRPALLPSAGAHSPPCDHRRRRPRAGVIAVFTVVYLRQQPILLTGTGYAAHNACAVTGSPAATTPRPTCRRTRSSRTCRSTSTATGHRARCWAPSPASEPGTPRASAARSPTSVPSSVRHRQRSEDANPLTDAPVPAADPDVEASIGRAFGDELPSGEPSRWALARSSS